MSNPFYEIDETNHSVTFYVDKIAEKFIGLDVAQMLFREKYKGYDLLIGIEKDWKKYGDDKGVANLKIGDPSGLYHVASCLHMFDFVILHPITIFNLDDLVLAAERKMQEIYELEH